jgi:hypothetical protein
MWSTKRSLGHDTIVLCIIIVAPRPDTYDFLAAYFPVLAPWANQLNLLTRSMSQASIVVVKPPARGTKPTLPMTVISRIVLIMWRPQSLLRAGRGLATSRPAHGAAYVVKTQGDLNGMTTYTSISNTLVAVGAKPFASTIQALRDNPIAIGEADSSVPAGLLPTVHLGTITTTSGSSQTLSGLDLTPYKFLRAVWDGVSHNAGGFNEQSFLFGGVFLATFQGAATARGFCEIDLSDGTIFSLLANAGNSTGNVGTAQVNAGTSSIVNASTSVTISVSGNSFDAGSVRIYGMK